MSAARRLVRGGFDAALARGPRVVEDSPMEDSPIALYGATGFTGRLVASELARRRRSFVASARNRAKLESLVSELSAEHEVEIDARVASVSDPASLDAMVEGAQVLMNCAGPFIDLGPPVARAAVRCGVHYLDTTGEQPHMKWVDEHLGDAAAAEGVALVPACAYEYAPGDLVARVATKRGARRVGICYAVRDVRTSQGTKKSIVRALSREGYAFVDGRLQLRKPGSRLFDVPLPAEGRRVTGAWFPGGEPLTVPRYADVEQVETCLAVGRKTATLLRVASPVIDKIAGVATGAADRLVDMIGGDPDADGGRSEFLTVAFDPRDGEFYAAVSGAGVYDATARIIALAAERIVDTAPAVVGFTSPAALFEPREFVKAVGMTLTEGRAGG